jgi:hypothetical protein
MVGRFASVEQFWSYYCHLVRPCELSGHSDFHLFKDGIKPMWEVVLLNSKKIGDFIKLLFSFRMMLIVVVANGLFVFEKVWPHAVGRT